MITLALIAGLYFGVNKYIEYHETQKIMNSDAGKIIKSFLDIIDKTNNDFPKLQDPVSSQEKDNEILKPFDAISAENSVENE